MTAMEGAPKIKIRRNMPKMYKIWLHVEERDTDTDEYVDLMNTHQKDPVSLGAECPKEEMERRMEELDYKYGDWP